MLTLNMIIKNRCTKNAENNFAHNHYITKGKENGNISRKVNAVKSAVEAKLLRETDLISPDTTLSRGYRVQGWMAKR